MNKPALYIVLFFLLSKCILFAQTNLIGNGDFESYSNCPTSISTPGDYQIEYCDGWNTPTNATSDYFNTCANWPVSIPNNTMGNIYPHSGDAYSGILIEKCNYPQCDGWWVEYVQASLTEPLKNNHLYSFSCYVSLSNKSFEYGYSGFGALFSQNELAVNNTKPLGYLPQVSDYQIIGDTNSWKKVEGYFVANGNEQFVTLGFFIDTNNLDTIRLSSIEIDPNNFQSYYFIDNCVLLDLGDDFELPNIFTPDNNGINDYWIPYSIPYSIEIVNRWGISIKTLEKGEFWDGLDRFGKQCSEGVYFYKYDNKAGYIHLVR